MNRWYAISLILLSGDVFVASAQNGFAQGEREGVARIVQACSFGSPAEIAQAASPVVARVSDQELAACTAALAEFGLPSASELLVTARLRLRATPQEKLVREPVFRERMRMLNAIADVRDVALDAAHELLRADLEGVEKNLMAYQERLLFVEVRRQQLLWAIQLSEYGQALLAKIPASNRSRLSVSEGETLSRNTPKRLDSLRQNEQALIELQLALRLQRLDLGIRSLHKLGERLTKESFLAAYTTDVDSRILLEALTPAITVNPAKGKPAGPLPPLFNRCELTDPDLLASIKRKLRDSREIITVDLSERARCFFEGLDWWLCGRYGWAAEVSGLVKPEQALNDPKLMHEVRLPHELFLPGGLEAHASARKPLDRRHLYTWAWEDRKLVRQSSANRSSYDFQTGQVRGRLIGAGYDGPGGMQLWGRHKSAEELHSTYLPPQSPRLVYRLVGFAEYSLAIEKLNRFVSIATPRELEVADELIRDRREFALPTNLSRRMEPAPNVISESGLNAQDRFERHGFRWVLAMARVEVAAMLAGFTNVANPFQVLVPTPRNLEKPEEPYGADEYLEMLQDGMRTHYWSLKNDPGVADYRRAGVPEEHLITYTRRATLAFQFLNATRQLTAKSLTPAQLALMNQWEQELASIFRMLVYCLAKKQGQERLAREYFDRGNAMTAQSRQVQQISRKPLVELMELADPTLRTCACR